MAKLEPPDANLRTYLRVMRRRAHWIVATTVLAVALAVAFSSVQAKRYSATAQLLAQPTSGSLPVAGTQQTVSPTDVLTDLQLLTGAAVEAKAEKTLGFVPSIAAVQVGQTNVIGLTATASSPTLAARVANTYAKTFEDYQRTNAINSLTSAETLLQGQIGTIGRTLAPLVAEKSPSSATTAEISALTNQQTTLQEQLAQLQLAGSESPGGIEVVSAAIPPVAPSSPKPVKDAVIALLIGLALGLAIAFLIEYFDDKVYTKEQAERLTEGVPVLAMIPKIRAWKKSTRPMLIADIDPFSPVTESYRSLRTSLQFAGHDGQLRTILITSASGSDGKTSTVANLALVLANAGERVVVVGCDLRRPRVAGFFGRNETPGFTNVLLGQEDLKASLQSVTTTAGLALLATGPIPPNPAELLGSARTAEIFRTLASAFDVVIIDSPPLLPVADAQVISNYADAVLLVVAAGETTQAELVRATELLTQVGARPTGIVLNKVARRAPGSSGDNAYQYKYRYAPSGAVTTMQNGNAAILRPAGARSDERRTGS